MNLLDELNLNSGAKHYHFSVWMKLMYSSFHNTPELYLNRDWNWAVRVHTPPPDPSLLGKVYKLTAVFSHVYLWEDMQCSQFYHFINPSPLLLVLWQYIEKIWHFFAISNNTFRMFRGEICWYSFLLSIMVLREVEDTTCHIFQCFLYFFPWESILREVLDNRHFIPLKIRADVGKYHRFLETSHWVSSLRTAFWWF